MPEPKPKPKKKKKKKPAPSSELVPSALPSPIKNDLDHYLVSIRQHPLLSPERELEIAKKIYEDRDPDAIREMILSNLRLVVKIAHDYVRSGFSLLDLIQEGNVGLLQAVREYDPYRGVKFSSYASYWIKAYMRSFILKNWSLVKMGTTRAQRSLFYKLQKEKNQMEIVGIIPETRQLADKFQVKEREVEEMTQRLSGRDVSIDAPLRGEDSGGEGIIQFIDDGSRGADEKLAEAEIKREFESRLNAFENSLSGKELVVFRERLRSEEPKTLQEIGDSYGITRERVRQIEARIIEKLKDYMKKNARFMENVIDISSSD